TEDSILFSPPEGGGILFDRLTPGLNQMFDRLFAGRVTEPELCQEVMNHDGASGLIRYYQQMHWLGKQALLNHTVRVGEERWASIRRSVRQYQLQPKLVQPDGAYRRSRFAGGRCEGEELVLQSPRGYAGAVLHSGTPLLLLHPFARPHTNVSLCAQDP